jgi:hypothetical protein
MKKDINNRQNIIEKGHFCRFGCFWINVYMKSILMILFVKYFSVSIVS